MSYQQNYRPTGFSILPPVVKNILIINGILFLATAAFGARYNIDLNERLGLHYPTSSKFEWYQFLTYMFMHAKISEGGIMHIFFNMYAVWMFGSVLENYWGPKRFLIFYIVTGLGAALIQTLYTGYQIHALDAVIANPDAEGYLKWMSKYYTGTGIREMFDELKKIPQQNGILTAAANDLSKLRMDMADITTVGASGAVFGLLLAFGMLFPNTELMILFFPIPIKAKIFVIIYGAVELFSGVAQTQGDNIAHFAHLGGMLFGFVLIKLWQKNRKFFY